MTITLLAQYASIGVNLASVGAWWLYLGPRSRAEAGRLAHKLDDAWLEVLALRGQHAAALEELARLRPLDIDDAPL